MSNNKIKSTNQRILIVAKNAIITIKINLFNNKSQHRNLLIIINNIHINIIVEPIKSKIEKFDGEHCEFFSKNSSSHVTCSTIIGLYTRSSWDVPSEILGS